MDIRSGIIEAAQALGVSPNDLATIISYETGGTFDPMQRGPTTRYGQHMGLIQFGGPQRQRYGVDLSSPEAALNSQLGANGAIVRYMKDAGVRPGTDLLNMYSAVNAGTVGQTGAMDRGTSVQQKVAGMGGHQSKATALLGGQWSPSTLTAQTGTPAQGFGTDMGGKAVEDMNQAYEELLASRPETREQPRSLLADTMASSVGRRGSGGGGITPSAADQGTAPLPDLAPPATPEAAPAPEAEATPTASLAELFTVGDVGLANEVNPVTGTPRLLRTRRTYG